MLTAPSVSCPPHLPALVCLLASFGSDEPAAPSVGLDPETLERLQRAMDEALEVLNTPTELADRVEAVQRITALLEEDPVCVQECIEMNGVQSIVSVIKEDVDEELQALGLHVIADLCDNDQALEELLLAHAMNYWAHAVSEGCRSGVCVCVCVCARARACAYLSVCLCLCDVAHDACALSTSSYIFVTSPCVSTATHSRSSKWGHCGVKRCLGYPSRYEVSEQCTS
jgi:hypothetical protein